MSGQTFLVAALVVAALTMVPLLWGLNVVKQRSSRGYALGLALMTALGVLVLVVLGRLAVVVLD